MSASVYHEQGLSTVPVKQLHLSAIVQARQLSLVSHIAQMPETCQDLKKKILTASLLKNWRRPPVPSYCVDEDYQAVQQHLKSLP